MSTWGSASIVSGNSDSIDAVSVRREHERGRTHWSGVGLGQKSVDIFGFRPYVWRERKREARVVVVDDEPEC